MLNENGLTFKDFEKKTFEMICKLGQEYTKDFLERYDIYLMENRDKNAYRNKGKRTTTVKRYMEKLNTKEESMRLPEKMG